MTLRSKFHISLAINLLITLLLLSATFKYREKIYQLFFSNTEKANIVMYGNSIVAQGKWTELLMRTDVANSGLPGRVTFHFLQEIKPQVLDKKPKVCFVMGGINDITVGVEDSIIRYNYSKIVETLLNNNIKPVVSATLYEKENPESMVKIKRLNAFLEQYCKKNAIIFLNPNNYLSDSLGLKTEYAFDKTHLNEKAYGLWAKDISSVLAQLGI